MTLLSATLTGSSLQILPSPFTSSLCYRQTVLYYAIPLSLNLITCIYCFARVLFISHWKSSSWWIVVEDGRIRRAGVLSVWIASSFAQEIGFGNGSGSGLWLPVSIGAGTLLGELRVV